MIVIKVELWPYGHESKAKEIGRMHIINDGSSDNPKRDNYLVKLLRRGSTSTVRKEGAVHNHPRLHTDIWTLVQKAVNVVL